MPVRRAHPDDWRPNPGPQTRFLSLTCREALYGGAAGGGKTASLLVDAVRYVGKGYGAKYQALLLRRTFPDLEKSLVQQSAVLYPRLGGRYNGQQHCWTFPTGEKVWFGYCEHVNDVLQYQSAEFQFLGFDELTHFAESQYLYMFSRLRSSAGIPLRMRAGTNPGGPGHEWVFKRWSYWLDPDAPLKAEPSQVLYVLPGDGEETIVPKGTPRAIGRCFVPALLEDNPHIGADYEDNLAQLDRVERQRLRYGDWLVKPAAGMYFKRGYFKIVDAAPARATRVRYWDRAATGESEATKRRRKGPDWTVGLRLAKTTDGIYYVEDVVRFRGKPLEVRNTVKQTAQLDGKGVLVGIEQDPGQAGVSEAEGYVGLLDGYNVRRYPARQDKVVRASTVSAQAEAGNVCLVAGAWNKAFLDELEDFPDGDHDDIVDALSGAHQAIARPVAPKSDALFEPIHGALEDPDEYSF